MGTTSDRDPSVALPTGEALDHGDLTRILLVLDDRLRKIGEEIAVLPSVVFLREYHGRLVSTRDKIQAAWALGLKKPKQKRAKKAKKNKAKN